MHGEGGVAGRRLASRREGGVEELFVLSEVLDTPTDCLMFSGPMKKWVSFISDMPISGC